MNLAAFPSRNATPMKHLPKHIQNEFSKYNKLSWFLSGSPYIEYISETLHKHTTSLGKILHELGNHLLKKEKPTPNRSMYSLCPNI